MNEHGCWNKGMRDSLRQEKQKTKRKVKKGSLPCRKRRAKGGVVYRKSKAALGNGLETHKEGKRDRKEG